MNFKNPQEAFEQAIREGRLSDNPSAGNYAGDYMYMGPTASGEHDAFKHVVTRAYLPLALLLLLSFARFIPQYTEPDIIGAGQTSAPLCLSTYECQEGA